MNDPSYKINKSLRQFYDSALNNDDESEEAAVVSELDAIEERYDCEEKIASGGMKDILKSHDKMTDRTVAKGVIRNKESHVTIEKFIDEVRITASLEHPNIIPIYDLGLTAEKEPFFTMKLVEGDDLQQILDRLSKNDEEALSFYNRDRLLEIFLKVCDAVEYAHSKNIVHLDIKPANVQVGQFGEVLLCDWGLARELNNGSVAEETDTQEAEQAIGMTMDGYIKGSPGFMAPEQISNEVGQRSKKTDIYSLGCLLYNVLTLKAPIETGDVDTMLKQTLEGDVAVELDGNPNKALSVSLSAVISKAMKVKPEERYKSVGDLSEEIRAYTRGFATEAENAGFIQVVSLLIKRHKTVATVIASFTLLTAVLSTFFLVKVNHEKSVVLTINGELISEQKKSEEASNKAAEYILTNSIHHYYQRTFDKTTSLGLQATELNPKNTEAWKFLAYYYLGELKAGKAQAALVHVNDKAGDWLKAKAQLLQNLTKGDKVSVENAVKFRNLMAEDDPKFRRGISHHVNYTVTRHYSLDERILYAELSASLIIKEIVKVERGKDGLSLDFSQYKKRVRDLVFLEKLPLVKLDISNSLVNDLNSLKGMPIKELNIALTPLLNMRGLEDLKLLRINISDSKISSLHFLPKKIEFIELGRNKLSLNMLKNFPNLKRVILPKGFYSEKELDRLKGKFEIVFKE